MAGRRRAPAKPNPDQGGRPSKLTDEVREEIASQLASGCTLEDAALAVGVHRTTIQTWLRLGREAIAGEDAGKKPTARDRPYLELARAEDRARAENRVKLLTTVQIQAAKGDWKAAAYLLEKLYPEDYAPAKGKRERPTAGRPVGASSAPDRQSRKKARPGAQLRAVS